MLEAPNQAEFRLYAELNDFVAAHRGRGRAVLYRFWGRPAVKDAIEAIGVPHTEVDLIVCNGASVDFSHHIGDGDRVSVYPVFESLDVTPLQRLRPSPLRTSRFLVDRQLGRLARLLRMLGFDAAYARSEGERELVEVSLRDRRIVVTRNINLLKRGDLTHGYWVRSAVPDEQVREVLDRFDLYSQVRPFRRCMECNGAIVAVEKEDVIDALPPRVRGALESFWRCSNCRRVYWRGSHYKRMKAYVSSIISSSRS